jgi:hypothetical protein
MTLISVRWRETAEPPAIDVGAVARIAALLLAMPASWIGSQLVWQHAGGPLPLPQALDTLPYAGRPSPLAIASLFAPFGAFIGLRFARVVDRGVWTPAWAFGSLWALQSLGWIVPNEVLLAVWLVPLPWAWFGIWPCEDARPTPLHRARWATRADLRRLLVKPARDGLPPAEGLVLGRVGISGWWCTAGHNIASWAAL